jgi:hypothetical protein
VEQTDEFFAGVDDVRAEVFATHAELKDHRTEFSWLTGCLGNPFAPVWFIAENPSLTQVRKLPRASREQQWSVSPGDKLFRAALAQSGFKQGGPNSPGGWHCYITDVIKSADVVNIWRAKPAEVQERVATAWAPVMRYELERGKPQFLVVLGEKAERLLKLLSRRQLIPPLPRSRRVYHYSYIGSRPDNHGRGPGDPERIAEWNREFERVAHEHPPVLS